MSRLLRLIILGLCLQGVSAAELRLAALFSDGMVLQRGRPVPVWGWAAAEEEVELVFGAQRLRTRADAAGRWRVELASMEASATPGELVLRSPGSGETRRVSDVLVGEVWLCSGQSNMAWPLRLTDQGRQVAAGAEDPSLRLFRVKVRVSPSPEEDVEGVWIPCTPETAPDFPATALYFARHLRETLGVPVGLIGSYRGETAALPWTPLEALRPHETFARAVARVEGATPERLEAAYQTAMARWRERVRDAEAGTRPPPEPPHWSQDHRFPTGLFNGMIAPLAGAAIAGVIWYQGETDTNHGSQVYEELFQALIGGWRAAWGREDLPFLFVQLANYRNRAEEPEFSNWDRLREAQARALTLPNTAMAVAIDIGGTGIHPGNKRDVGDRLALAARRVVYGEDLVYSGPVFREMRVEGRRVDLEFDHTGGGLVLLHPPARRDGSAPSRSEGFAIAGEDRVFHWAEAEVTADRVTVWSDAVEAPVAVRYGIGMNPAVNLYNREGLPAVPFRTDTWTTD